MVVFFFFFFFQAEDGIRDLIVTGVQTCALPIILKDHYQGLQVRGQGGISKYGDGGSYFVSALAGKNFADGRGNIAVNLEYARRDQAWGDQRSWLRNTLVNVDADKAGIPNGSDGVPD